MLYCVRNSDYIVLLAIRAIGEQGVTHAQIVDYIEQTYPLSITKKTVSRAVARLEGAGAIRMTLLREKGRIKTKYEVCDGS